MVITDNQGTFLLLKVMGTRLVPWSNGISNLIILTELTNVKDVQGRSQRWGFGIGHLIPVVLDKVTVIV